VLLHLVGDGQAIVMDVWQSRGEDVRVTCRGDGRQRMIEAAEIRSGEAGTLWVAVIEAPGVWHMRPITNHEAGRIIPLKWRAPFPAVWRVDWRRPNQLTDSWEMAIARPGEKFVRYGWYGLPETLRRDRRRWTTVLGWFQYPCWLDRRGRGYLQPLKQKVRFEGPAVMYPLHRMNDTPRETYTVMDVLRATLGLGPCEYLLDLEGQATTSRGRATCSTRDTLDTIYKKGTQRRHRARIEETLDEVMVFIRYIRTRIEAYVAFGHEMQAYLVEQKRAHPELARHITELEALTRAIDARVRAREATMQTPTAAAELVQQFRATLIHYEGRDAFQKCKRITQALVKIGGSQDELVGECRWAVKALRQRAGLLLAVEPGLADVAREVRRRTHQMLRRPAVHEAPRH